MRSFVLILALLATTPWLAATSPSLRHVSDQIPVGLPLTSDPEDNPVTPERLELGRSLFFDTLLSADRTVSCASCHRPDHGFSSPERFPEGARGRRPSRHAPTLLNRAWGESFFWDGRVTSLEEQVLRPVENENEMALPLPEAIERLASSASYATLFAAAYSDGVTRENLGKALAGFVRRIRIGGSPVDLFRDGNISHLGREEKAGLWVYESKGRCWRCHSGPNFTDEAFHNTGVGVVDGQPEPGRFAVTGDAADRGRFKTPTLRGLVHTAPFMHDGSIATLEEVVEFYRQGGRTNSHLDADLARIEMTDEDARNLVIFLRSLSAEVAEAERKER